MKIAHALSLASIGERIPLKMLTPQPRQDVASLTYDQFRGDDPNLFDRLTDIASFALRTKVGYLGSWTGSEAQRIAFRLHDFLTNTLELMGFYSPEQLEVRFGKNELMVEYGDAEYGFTIGLTDQGLIALRRTGSSMKRFHEWFTKVIPSAEGIITEILAALKDEHLRSGGHSSAKFPLEYALYDFRFVAYDFYSGTQDSKGSEAKRVSNFTLMKRALTLLPSDDGRLADADSQSHEQFGRIDYSVTRWKALRNSKAREIYRVEAPSNNEWSSLWFNFVFVGDTYISPVGERSPFAAETFFDTNTTWTVYVDFLRDRALNGFLDTMTSGYRFRTTPSVLP